MDELNFEVLDDSGQILDDDGHFIDDPLFVVDCVMDYLTLGLDND